MSDKLGGLSILALIVGYAILRWLPVAFAPKLAIVAAVFVVVVLIPALWQRQRLDWTQRHKSIVTRVDAGQTDAVHAELTKRYHAGDHAVDVLAGLVLTHTRLGRWRETKPYVVELRDHVKQHGLCARTDLSSRAQCDLALFAQADLLIALGRYADAAKGLRARIAKSASPNQVTAAAAWCYFLADDSDSARVMLSQVKPVEAPDDNTLAIAPGTRFMVAYMRHALTGADTRAELAWYRGEFRRWQAEAARYEDSPYAARLRAILDDVRPLLPDDAISAKE